MDLWARPIRLLTCFSVSLIIRRRVYRRAEARCAPLPVPPRPPCWASMGVASQAPRRASWVDRPSSRWYGPYLVNEYYRVGVSRCLVVSHTYKMHALVVYRGQSSQRDSSLLVNVQRALEEDLRDFQRFRQTLSHRAGSTSITPRTPE